ncbi:MAG: hypothetical protein ACR2OZ_09870 [Verrucomicrobiales bacterium]
MARGNRREAIFLADVDRQFFLDTLAEACAMTGWRAHAWVLMSSRAERDRLAVGEPEARRGGALICDASQTVAQKAQFLYRCSSMNDAASRPETGNDAFCTLTPSSLHFHLSRTDWKL